MHTHWTLRFLVNTSIYNTHYPHRAILVWNAKVNIWKTHNTSRIHWPRMHSSHNFLEPDYNASPFFIYSQQQSVFTQMQLSQVLSVFRTLVTHFGKTRL